jgi:hypothetical protein
MAVPAQRSVAIAIYAPLRPGDLAGLLARTCALLERSACELLCCEVTGLDADAVSLDALARLALAGRRYGCAVVVRGASEELLRLVAFAGLSEVLRPPEQGPGS